jgi:hypothetical protein
MFIDLKPVILVLKIGNEGPETDMSRPGFEPGPPRWEASTQEKSNSNSLLKAIRNIYI